MEIEVDFANIGSKSIIQFVSKDVQLLTSSPRADKLAIGVFACFEHELPFL